MSGSVNVLISSAGRRVRLAALFARAISELGISGEVFAVDTSPLSATWQLASRRWLVPPCTTPEFIPAMLDLCAQNEVRLVIPTIDTELGVLARHREEFAAIGTTVAVSAPATVAIAADKELTNAWLREHGFPTVRQAQVSDVLARPSDWPLPLVAKPRSGSSSIGLLRVTDDADLAHLRRFSDHLVESVAPGIEHTVDVLVGRAGDVACAVPRRRIEVRGGEVSKGVTVRSKDMQDLATAIAAALPGAFGPLNVQMFKGADGALNVIEINARFGGGFPLSAHAGADFPRWLLEEALDMPSTRTPDAWKDGLCMLRYDAEVFVDMPPEAR